LNTVKDRFCEEVVDGEGYKLREVITAKILRI
jgi:hypothetical protein